MNIESLEKNILQIGRQAKEASRYVSQLSTQSKNEILCSAADNLLKNKESILKANELDIKENKDKLNSATLDRLVLDEKRIESISSGLVEISGLEDPVGKIIDKWSRPNGLEIEKTSIPLGVIGVIYESRPNVSADAAGLCLKSGNALILRGGSESFNSSSKIVEIINPVFLINCEYLSVYWKDMSNMKTSTRISIVKKSIKKTPFKLSV